MKTRYKELKETVLSMENDANKYEIKDNDSASERMRTKLRAIRRLCEIMRDELLGKI